MSLDGKVRPAGAEPNQAPGGATGEEIAAAMALADAAHRTWSRSATVIERAALLSRVADLHLQRREHLATILTGEMGKPIEQALGEIDFCADIYRYYAENAETFLADEPIDLRAGEGTAFLRRSPMGVLLGIMPWNYPYYQVARFAGPNIVAGNTILLKPAPQCPGSAMAIEQLFADAGFPAGVYTSISASVDQIQAVIGDPRIRGVSLTGSEKAGAAVAATAGRHLKKVVLELGGSDPFIVLSSDDLTATVDAAVAARMENGGQACNAAKRFIVVADLYDEFVGALTSALLAYEPGDPRSTETTLGPLSSVAAADRLEDQVNRAVEQGATLARAGTSVGANFAPAVLTDLSPDNSVRYEELFGPVAMVHRVASEAEAISVANETPFGLGSYVFTNSSEQALRVADALDAGMVFINIVGADGAELPFGGVKNSGYGRELGRFGADEFVNKKLIRVGGK